MAACGGLEHINFDITLSEDPWKQIKAIGALAQSPSFKQMFTESQHLEYNSHNLFQNPSEPSASSNSMFSGDENGRSVIHHDKNGSFASNDCSLSEEKKEYRHSDSFSSVNSDNLSICTEGLGVESYDDVDDLLKNEVFTTTTNNNDCQLQNTKMFTRNRSVNHWGESKMSRTCIGEFPPPISCIGKCGKPFVRFKSYRQDGRFILKEIRVPELLHARRENGRLRMNLIQSDDNDDNNDDGDESCLRQG